METWSNDKLDKGKGIVEGTTTMEGSGTDEQNFINSRGIRIYGIDNGDDSEQIVPWSGPERHGIDGDCPLRYSTQSICPKNGSMDDTSIRCVGFAIDHTTKTLKIFKQLVHDFTLLPSEVVNEWRDKGYGRKFIRVTMANELKDEHYKRFVKFERIKLCRYLRYHKFSKNKGIEMTTTVNPLETVKNMLYDIEGSASKLTPSPINMAKESKYEYYKGIMEKFPKDIAGIGMKWTFNPSEMRNKWYDEGSTSDSTPFNRAKESWGWGGYYKGVSDGVAMANEFLMKKDQVAIDISENVPGHEAGGDAVAGNTSWWKKGCTELVQLAKDCFEQLANPKMGLSFLGGIMLNTYVLISSGTVNTSQGKALFQMNEAAFLMLLYGLIVPRRAWGRPAVAGGVLLTSASFLYMMTYVF